VILYYSSERQRTCREPAIALSRHVIALSCPWQVFQLEKVASLSQTPTNLSETCLPARASGPASIMDFGHKGLTRPLCSMHYSATSIRRIYDRQPWRIIYCWPWQPGDDFQLAEKLGCRRWARWGEYRVFVCDVISVSAASLIGVNDTLHCARPASLSQRRCTFRPVFIPNVLYSVTPPANVVVVL